MAILKGLRIGTGDSAAYDTDFGTTVASDRLKRAAGDHLEAWQEAMSAQGSRLNFKDALRNRSILGGWRK